MTDETESVEWLLQQPEASRSEISDRDRACAVLLDVDYEAQLVAISSLLWRHREEEARTVEQIEKADDFARKSVGLINMHATDQWVDLLHASSYQDAAHSMAALGMLAPLIESLFYQAGISRYPGEILRSICHSRWPRAKWDAFGGGFLGLPPYLQRQ